MRKGCFFSVLLLAVACSRHANGEDVEFAYHVRPILANYCYDCHGPDETRRRANLRLDTDEGWTTKLESGRQLVVAGKRQQSELWRRITSHDPEVRMPAAESGKRLTRDQIELIGRWIDNGAKWSSHWAYTAPQRPALPAVKNNRWPSNAIDRFVLARLERESLAPSPPAAREQQLRRLSLDLTGLPPTLTEFDEFLVDSSHDAYERAVDRLLASPRFGERMAQDWLDLARYADTHGYHSDSQRDMWRWRDWVIDALNHNMPFDQFTIEQLAGDLLPEPTLAQRIATGFHRNNMVNFENGAIPEEYRTEYVIDRVITTGAVWLGQTWVCARCHDHKYDPISQQDFYRLFAYFNNVPENGLDGRAGNAVPFLSAPTEEQQQELDRFTRRLEELSTELKQRANTCDEDFLRWQREKAKNETMRRPPGDMTGYFPLDKVDGKELPDLATAERPARIHGQNSFVPGKFAEALLFDGQTHVELRDRPVIERDLSFTLSVWMFPTSEEKATLLARVDDDFTSRGFTLAWDERKLMARLRNQAGDEIIVSTTQQLPLRKWQHVAVTYNGGGKASGLVIYVNGSQADQEITNDNLQGSVTTGRPWQLGLRDAEHPWRGMLDEVRMYARSLSTDEIELLAGGDPYREVLAKPAAQRTKQESEQLRSYYLENHDTAYRDLRSQHAAVLRAKERLERLIPTTMVMQELPTPRAAFVLERGLYNRPQQQVSPGVPEQLLPARNLPPNRLGLAQWLVDRRHPLTARVVVNRYWSHFFGRGLVATPEDFGVRGSPPSHPQLLDWLAVEFMESGWDVKHLVRLIVTSNTYRQASIQKNDSDPENVLLSRGPRLRLPAEAIRDSALAAGGLLAERVGGPSVNPYQPTDLWKDLAYDATSFSAQSFHPSRGADLYRRSVYTFWKRTAPHPLLAAFDAPNRETCTVQRARTSSPLQSLALLNDVTFIETSRGLAESVLRGPAATTEECVEQIFRTLLSRKPSRTEQERLKHLFDEQRRTFRADPEQAQRLIAFGKSPADSQVDAVDLAAWTTVASVVMNLEEFVTK